MIKAQSLKDERQNLIWQVWFMPHLSIIHAILIPQVACPAPSRPSLNALKPVKFPILDQSTACFLRSKGDLSATNSYGVSAVLPDARLQTYLHQPRHATSTQTAALAGVVQLRGRQLPDNPQRLKSSQQKKLPTRQQGQL